LRRGDVGAPCTKSTGPHYWEWPHRSNVNIGTNRFSWSRRVGIRKLGIIDPSRAVTRQHFLNFFPLPHGHGSLRQTPLNGFASCWLRASAKAPQYEGGEAQQEGGSPRDPKQPMGRIGGQVHAACSAIASRGTGCSRIHQCNRAATTPSARSRRASGRGSGRGCTSGGSQNRGGGSRGEAR